MKIIRTALGVVLGVAAVLSCRPTAQAPAPSTEPRPPRPLSLASAIRYLSTQIEASLASSRIPGLAIAIVDGDRVMWVKGFGYTGRGTTQRVTPDTLFSVQSISKQFTALGFLRAVDRGLVKLDDPLMTVLPAFRVHSRFRGDDDARAITFRHLLSHRAGLAHEAPTGGNMDFRNVSFDEHVRSISDTWLRSRPGAYYSYSNLGVDLVGYALQVRTGKPFAEYEKAAVFDPLGMTTATFDPTKIPATIEIAEGDIEAAPPGAVPYIPMVPAGAMFASVNDLAQYLRMQLAHGERDGRPFVSKALLEQMLTPQFLTPEQTTGYGLALQSQIWRGAMEYFHTGGGFGYSAILEWVPAYHVGVAVLSNTANSDVYAIAARAMSLVYAMRTGSEPPRWVDDLGTTVPVAGSDLRRLEGTYRLGNNPLVQFEVRDGDLFYRGVGPREPTPLTALGATEFVGAAWGTTKVRWAFDLDPAGRPRGVRERDDVYLDGAYFLLNDQPGEPPGPALPEWNAWLGVYTTTAVGAFLDRSTGRYAIRTVGPEKQLELSVRNGYLTVVSHDDAKNEMAVKITEWAPDLFFTADGDSLKLESDHVIFANVVYTRAHR